MTRTDAAQLWALVRQLLPDWEMDTDVLPQFKAQRDGDGALFGIVIRVKPRGEVDREHLRRK